MIKRQVDDTRPLKKRLKTLDEQPCTSKQAMQQNGIPKDAGTQTICGKVVDDKKMVSGIQILHDTLRERKVYKPRILKCNIPFEQDVKYARVVYKGHGTAIIFHGVRDGNTICLSLEMLQEITRRVRYM